ncbi:MAG: hypothetical protein GC179_02175 [Anaerolineaceae bacterium]|nr:hypothetical protein [Anaerolineaceae bacterium]
MQSPSKIRMFLVAVMVLLLAACNQPAPTSEPTQVAVASDTPLPTEPPLITPTPGDAPTQEQPTLIPPTSQPTDVITSTSAATSTATQVSAATATTVPTIDLTPSKTPIVENNAFALGAHVFGFAHFNQMHQAGMTWLKLQIRWDGTSAASAVQPQIASARGGGFKVLLSVVGDIKQLAADRPAYISKFTAYVAGLAALSPDAMEIWNEPNIDREWPNGQISGGNYAQMLIAAYNAIKAVNPAVMVISGAPAPTGFFGGQCAASGCDDNIFITQMQQAGAGNALDCVGMHYNDGIVPPDKTSGDPRGSSNHYSRYFKTLVNLYSSVFPGKPVCFTELGYLTAQGYGPLPAGFEWAANTTIQNQADWQALAAKIAKSGSTIRLIIVWNLDATEYGADPMAGYAIIRKDGSCPACVSLGAVMNTP